MNPREAEQREELLVGLMADYDEALAADASTNAFDKHGCGAGSSAGR